MKANSLSPRVAGIIFLAGLAVALSFLATKLNLQWTNTLKNNQHWVASKAQLQKGANGAVAYFITPIALDKNRLNLGAWFGFQEVLFKERIDPEEIQFDFELMDAAYLNFIFNQGPSGFSGIRFSQNRLFPPLYFTASPEGKFLKKETFKLKGLQEGWNHFHARWEENKISVYLNDQPLGTFEENSLPRQGIGFRGGYQPVYIDNFRMKFKNASEEFFESFNNPKNFWKVFIKSLALLLLLNTLILALAWLKLRNKDPKRMIYYPLVVNLVLLVLGLPLYFVDYGALSNTYLFSKMYFKVLTTVEGYKNSIETRDEVLTRLRREYSSNQSNGAYKIIFLGTSQTWGAGAKEGKDIFVHRIAAQLPHYQVINAGISGEKSFSLLDLYAQEWIQWGPQLAALNLSNNDQDAPQFSEALEKFVKLNKSKGIQTIFILEANSQEAIRQNLPRNHQIMREIAHAEYIPVIDLQDCLLKNYDSGFLWWDFVHLSSWGQDLAAHCLMEPLAEFLREKNPQFKMGGR